MNKIDASYFLSNQETKRAPSSELGKDEFLKILMTQLQNQDPLNPMQDTDFIAQMAQFSSLEQMMNMATSIDTLVHNQLVSPVVQYSHMIGKHVLISLMMKKQVKKQG
ncbi:flagellar hook assembly protein FlgD [Paracerasibacillus soli]|uniref:Flagellar hook assembly protein FlgD n=1 Tax=Paracerasibacillus soli TaxID=480284 RepID=A0ABU5CQS7_9BACI|nr:flagellar hook assembly protein FlgD [Virgibacillus soli]MDY0408164.1 flagellar hook assembly protein FlgD [Virgibacillus soli]